MSSTRRFWDEARAEHTAEGWAVMLDGRPMRLPGGAALRLESRALAEALAAEWAAAGQGARGGTFGPDDVPLTRIAGTMIERVAPDRAATIAALAAYAEHDLLCYRAAPFPDPLMPARQAEQWDPWVTWARTTHGLPLTCTQGVMPLPRAPDLVARAAAVLAPCSNAVLAGLGVAVPVSGSFVLGLALALGAIDAERTVALATLDEESQLSVWGEDPEQRARLAALASDIADAARFMLLAASV